MNIYVNQCIYFQIFDIFPNLVLNVCVLYIYKHTQTYITYTFMDLRQKQSYDKGGRRFVNVLF